MNRYAALLISLAYLGACRLDAPPAGDGTGSGPIVLAPAASEVHIVEPAPAGEGTGDSSEGTGQEAATEAGVPGRLDRFFAREPLGFSTDTFAHAADDVRHAAREVGDDVGGWWDGPVASKLTVIGGILGLVLFLWLLSYLDRRVRRWAEQRAERWGTPGARPAGRLLAVLAAMLGLVVLPAVLLFGSYVLVRGILKDQLWPVALNHALLVWLAYRSLLGLLRQIVNPQYVAISAVHVAQLHRWCAQVLRVLLVFLVARGALAAVDYRADVVSLLDFALLLLLSLLIFRAVRLKAAVLDLLPDAGPRAYMRFRGVFERFYVHLVVLTGVLGLLWTFGYRRAATEILWRVYVGIAIGVVAGLAFRWLQQRLERPSAGETRSTLRVVASAAGSYLKFFLILLVVVTGLRILGLWNPLLVALRYPLIVIGRLQISTYVLANALLVFLTFMLVSRALRSLLEERVYPRFEWEEGVAFAVGKMVHYALLVFGFVAALVAAGIDLGVLALFAGALGVGIGFGLQEVVRDLVAGFVLLFGRAVKKGDVISLNQSLAEVKSVGARSVLLRTRDNVELVVPTSKLVNDTIVNWTHTDPTVRLRISVGCSYRADPKVVQTALLEAADEFPAVAKTPHPRVWLTEFGADGVVYELVIWFNAKRYAVSTLKGELNFVIWDKLGQHGIEIPFPQRDLHIKSIEPEVLEAVVRPARD